MRAGPRETIYHDPSTCKAAIVTCGGLCPGLNDVIRQLVITLEEYGVRDVRGIKYGFRGSVERVGELREPMVLTSKIVDTIHLNGGSILGSSRGGSDIDDIVDAITSDELDLDFCSSSGGNGKPRRRAAIDSRCADATRRRPSCACLKPSITTFCFSIGRSGSKQPWMKPSSLYEAPRSKRGARGTVSGSFVSWAGNPASSPRTPRSRRARWTCV